MFKFIGAAVVYGFAAFGLYHYLRPREPASNNDKAAHAP